MTPGQLITVDVEKPAAGGRMIARLNGQIVLVGGAIPGERVVAQVERVARGVAFASTTRTEHPSPDRRAPFADPLCGGCLFSHIAYPRQLEIKSLIVADAFARIGHLTLSSPPIVRPSGEEGYRMRARLHGRAGRIGFFREGTHDLCDVRATRQLRGDTCDVLDRLSAGLRSLKLDAVREIELSENVDASERVVHLGPEPDLDARTLHRLTASDGLTRGPHVVDRITIDGRTLLLRRHVLAFFQGNRYLLTEFVAHVASLVPAGATVIDLYAGVGLFSVATAALRSATVTAIEGDRFAAADLVANAADVGQSVVPVHQSVESSTPGHADAVIVDPPRTGLSVEALGIVLGVDAATLIYVSCDVATLARDARSITSAGYSLDRIDAFDLFPNTPHVETVVVFRR